MLALGGYQNFAVKILMTCMEGRKEEEENHIRGRTSTGICREMVRGVHPDARVVAGELLSGRSLLDNFGTYIELYVRPASSRDSLSTLTFHRTQLKVHSGSQSRKPGSILKESNSES